MSAPKLQYLENCNISDTKNEVAVMRIYKPIGSGGIDGSRFAEELHWVAENYKSIAVRINSPGGSVMEGYSIFSALVNCKVPLVTYNDGIAASMAGVCLLGGSEVYMADYAKFMMHNPSTGTNLTDKELEMLMHIKESLLQIFTTRSPQKIEQMSALMDVETWLSAQQALEMGLIDKIISYPIQRGKTTPTEQEASSPMNLYNFYNSILGEIEVPQPEKKPELKPSTKMEDKILDNVKNSLGLALDASEKETMKAINTLQAKEMQNVELQDLVNSLKAENEAMKAEREAEIKERVISFVENNIKAGKLKATKKDQFVKIGLMDFDLMVSTINDMAAPSKFSERISTADDKATMNFADLSNNHPEELARLRNEETDTYITLYKNHYGFAPKL